MGLSVLSVAYPFASVGPDTAGGAEQVLSAIDAALVAAGHRSIMVAAEGSRFAGTLVSCGRETGTLDDEALRRGHARCRAAIAAAVDRFAPDLVHMHGIDFDQYLPGSGPPVVVTLHLPPDWYGDALFSCRGDVRYVPVSATQARACPPGLRLLPPIENGVPVERLRARHAKRRFALFLGRICPEKGVHLAIEAARAAGMPLLVAGEVFPYPVHRAYFEAEVRPHLGRDVRFLGPIGFTRKRRLLSAARCLLVPSLAPETSSLVAREALACGTPVIAFDVGALPEIVEDGRTGFLVRSAAAMAEAIRRAGEIAPEACRAFARERFSLDRMTDAYLALYAVVAAGRA